MASLDWIAKTVDTAGRPCPVRLAEPCPGNRSQCAWWQEEIVEKARTAHETAAQGGCGIMWLYAIQHEVRDEAIRTQANLQLAASAVQTATGAVVAAMVQGTVPRLGGSSDGGPASLPTGSDPKQLGERHG